MELELVQAFFGHLLKDSSTQELGATLHNIRRASPLVNLKKRMIFASHLQDARGVTMEKYLKNISPVASKPSFFLLMLDGEKCTLFVNLQSGGI